MNTLEVYLILIKVCVSGFCVVAAETFLLDVSVALSGGGYD